MLIFKDCFWLGQVFLFSWGMVVGFNFLVGWRLCGLVVFGFFISTWAFACSLSLSYFIPVFLVIGVVVAISNLVFLMLSVPTMVLVFSLVTWLSGCFIRLLGFSSSGVVVLVLGCS